MSMGEADALRSAQPRMCGWELWESRSTDRDIAPDADGSEGRRGSRMAGVSRRARMREDGGGGGVVLGEVRRRSARRWIRDGGSSGRAPRGDAAPAGRALPISRRRPAVLRVLGRFLFRGRSNRWTKSGHIHIHKHTHTCTWRHACACDTGCPATLLISIWVDRSVRVERPEVAVEPNGANFNWIVKFVFFHYFQFYLDKNFELKKSNTSKILIGASTVFGA